MLERDGAPADTKVRRPRRIEVLLDQRVLDDAPTSVTSDALPVEDYRRFALYLRTLSAGAPTTVQYIVEFLEPRSGKWHRYNEGVFASLYYEDTATATEQDDIYVGYCLGRALRVRAVGTGTTASLTFTVSVAVELFD